MNIGSDGECDELDDLPCSRGNQWKGPISRKPSQTSVYLQEWDIPFEQLDLGELIGKVGIHKRKVSSKSQRAVFPSSCFIFFSFFLSGSLGQSAQGSLARRGRYQTS